jgi:hypothetical protein
MRVNSPSRPERVRGEEGMVEVKQVEVEEEAQLYQELEEIQFEVPVPGKMAKAKITKIVRGKLGVLIPIERIRNEAIKERLMQRADRDAIQIEVEHQGIRSRMTMIVSSAPNSTFYRLMKKYKGRLKVGDEIEVIFNDRGFPRPYLD